MKLIKKYLADETGDILVFLPGMKKILEIKEALAILQSRVNDPELLEEQRTMFLSTTIDETALTLPNFHHIINSGLVKVLVLKTDRHCQGLVERHISQSSETQRKGRAGRTQFGKVYRITPESFNPR